MVTQLKLKGSTPTKIPIRTERPVDYRTMLHATWRASNPTWKTGCDLRWRLRYTCDFVAPFEACAGYMHCGALDRMRHTHTKALPTGITAHRPGLLPIRSRKAHPATEVRWGAIA